MSTVDQLRSDIDAGRAGDKVAGSDPAAAPLGTDEEAAGTPISPAAVALARQQEVRGGRRTNEDGGTWLYMTALASIAGILAVSAFFLLT